MFCHQCGTENGANDLFCKKCGTRIGEAGAPAPKGDAMTSSPYRAPNSALSEYEDFELAGFWVRLAAYLLDSIIVGFFIGLLLGLAGKSESIWFVFAVMFVYFAVCEASEFQATLGKKIVGIKVVGLNGERISAGTSIGRAAGKLVSMLFTFSIGFIIAAFTDKKQALHDLMAKTLVVRSK